MDPISVNVLNIIGRVTEQDKQTGRVFAIYNADWSTANAYAFQFGVQSQGQTFGVVKAVKIDNGSNPENVEVAVSGTDDFFTVPSFSIGIYTLNANAGSTVILTSQGGATDLCTVTFYNYEVAPVVWYSFGAFNSDRPIKTYGPMSEATDIATNEFNNPVFVGGRDPSGNFRGFNTDPLGNLIVSNLAITIGAVYGPDNVGTPATRPGVLQAVLDSSGDVQNVTLTADDEFKVTDAKVLAAVDALETLVAATNTKLDDLNTKATPPGTGTVTQVASSATPPGVTILASNAARKGGIIFNDSTAILYLLFSATGNPSATNYSVQVPAGGSCPIGSYTGQIKGIWSAANGFAYATSLT